MKALIEAGVAFPPDTSQALLDAAVGQYVEANREQFRTRAVPVDPEDPDTLYQWVDENGDAIGDPVPFGSIVSVTAAAESTSTATAAGTTTLTNADKQVQIFTGTSTQTVKLPTTGVIAGQCYTIINQSTGAVTVQSSGANNVIILVGSRTAVLMARIDTPTAAADWDVVALTASTNSATLGSAALRDNNANLASNAFIARKQPTATSAGTITMGITSAQVQELTGTTTHTVKLPSSNVIAGMRYTIINNSTGDVTVQSSGANTISTLTTGTMKDFVAQIDTPTTAAHWAGYLTPSHKRDLPDRLLAETVVAKTVTITTGQIGTYTSIPSGVAACTFPAVDNKLSLVGTTSSKLAQVFTYDIYGPNWKTHPDGSVGTQGMYTSSFGVDFWVSNSQYVEFVTGTLDTNLCSYKLWVDGRPVTDLPVQTTWTNPSYNHIKLDLGDTAPHRVRLMLCFGGIARIFLQPTGTMWPAKHRGPRLYVLGDSLTQGTAMNTGRELGTWLPRFASMIGADDYWNGAISGTGPTTSTGGFPDFVTRATTEAAPSKGELIITGSFINSMGASQSQLEAAYNSIFDVLLAMPSNPYVIAYGATNPLGGTGGSYATFDGWVKNVCAARNVAYISSYTGKVFAPNGAEVADMGQWITTANTSVIIGGDNTHPTDAGHKVMAARFYEAYRALLAAN